ncbi:TBC1 domain family member 8B [Glycine max]|nr:TBC1 domain family member 8B [Glycine max]
MAHFSFNLLHSLEPKRIFVIGWMLKCCGGRVSSVGLAFRAKAMGCRTVPVLKRSLEVDSRDSYGFALRPQYAQTYREYSSIYKEEEDERSDKWSDFLEQVAESSEPTSENEHKDTLKAEPESNEVREERNPHKLSNGDDSSGRQFSELEEETIVVRKSAEGNEIIEETIQDRVSKGGDSSDRTTSGGTEIKEGTSPGRVSEGDDSSGRNFICYSATGNNSGKEQHHSEERKTCEVQRWAEIRPSLITIEEIFSSRIKKGKQMKGGKINGINVHLPSIEESEPVDDGINGSRAENALVDQNLPELFSRWKELESLVQGGVPKDLRGEVWQAFVGVKKRRVESYYEDLLARDESEEQDVSSAAFGKWKKQIEKDLPRTFPGHPALDENGRNSLRRLLLAYARHNPEVGYCQAMNFFAGLLLLLMPEENAFWAFAGIIDEYFAGYYTEDMIESQVVWLKVELCRLMEEKRSAILRAEELETALMEMVKEDNRLQLSARVEQLEQEVAELQQVIADKKEQEAAMLQVLVRLEQDQKVTEDARRRSEQDLAAHKFEVHVLQEKYDKAMQSIAEMQKRVVMAESMLEATLQYESGQSKALSSPRTGRVQSPRFENPTRKVSLLSFGLGWRDKNKGKPNAEESSESLHDHSSPRKESDNQ